MDFHVNTQWSLPFSAFRTEADLLEASFESMLELHELR